MKKIIKWIWYPIDTYEWQHSKFNKEQRIFNIICILSCVCPVILIIQILIYLLKQ